MTRAIQTIAVTVPFLIALAVGLAGGQWSKELWPAWVWATITLGVIVAVIFIGMVRRAYALEKALIPKIAIIGVDIHDNDGEHYVRVQIENASSRRIEGFKAQLHTMVPNVETISLRNTDDSCAIDLPIQLFTQERLKERLGGSRDFARPFNLDAREKRRLEIFQIVPRLRHLHIFDAVRRHDLSASADLRFECTIHGGGSSPTKFAVSYRAMKDGYKVTLSDANGLCIDEEESQ